MTRPPLDDVRILVWMCVLIGINQLGFGSVVPVLPLYARSFGVSQAAIGLAIAVYGLARFLVATSSARTRRTTRPSWAPASSPGPGPPSF